MAKAKKVQYSICPNCFQPSLLNGKCNRCGYIADKEPAAKVSKKTSRKRQ